MLAGLRGIALCFSLSVRYEHASVDARAQDAKQSLLGCFRGRDAAECNV